MSSLFKVIKEEESPPPLHPHSARPQSAKGKPLFHKSQYASQHQTPTTFFTPTQSANSIQALSQNHPPQPSPAYPTQQSAPLIGILSAIGLGSLAAPSPPKITPGAGQLHEIGEISHTFVAKSSLFDKTLVTTHFDKKNSRDFMKAVDQALEYYNVAVGSGFMDRKKELGETDSEEEEEIIEDQDGDEFVDMEEFIRIKGQVGELEDENASLKSKNAELKKEKRKLETNLSIQKSNTENVQGVSLVWLFTFLDEK